MLQPTAHYVNSDVDRCVIEYPICIQLASMKICPGSCGLKQSSVLEFYLTIVVQSWASYDTADGLLVDSCFDLMYTFLHIDVHSF